LNQLYVEIGEGKVWCTGTIKNKLLPVHIKREPPVTGVTDGPHTKNMNTKTVTNIVGFLTLQTLLANIFLTFYHLFSEREVGLTFSLKTSVMYVP
jgi:hypothetical protein